MRYAEKRWFKVVVKRKAIKVVGEWHDLPRKQQALEEVFVQAYSEQSALNLGAHHINSRGFEKVEAVSAYDKGPAR